ncbi:PREDICTED: polyadenylate-binding protein-interacting protein 7-like [Camelina sativa]|uniref:Polyadenylate-binding protein-interacting protein 7-like n=1 Tax=Camelina sativa TaxID=90675 RepID=A0ABM0SX59_CAMSA|nr:PREDICTED: polyadenylate-binding protein-interacting protein 7-like [Camelina sativa]XP_010417415.1 PREDICTED: polyadenylate-binding protein-interacting protein 7-like [Camelina sativa]XP_010417416.1 PREDICTED: polyadenylate-binding protein-interacting protein 7-like [Camelina sativa]
MSLTKKSSDPKLSGTSIKPTTLNPHAAEFVPFTLRSPSSGGTSSLDAASSRLLASSSSVGKGVLDRSESSASHHSDEEARQFWSNQLPDDLTPDFGLMTHDENAYGSGSLSLASLSLYDNANEAEKFPSAAGGYGFSDQTGLASHTANGNSLAEKSRFPISSFGEDPQRPNFMQLSPKPWDKQIMNAEQLLGNDRERNPFSGNSRHGFVNDLITETPGEMEVNPVDFLASQFPGFAAESLAEVYFANGCDLQLTVEMLTQLELQVDGGLSQTISPKPYAAPSLTPMDFPALSISNSHGIPAQFGGDDLQQTGNHYQSPEKDNMFFFKSGPSVSQPGSIDYVSAVRKLASQDSGIWKYERNDSADSSIGSSRNSQASAGAYKSGRGRGIYSDKLQSRAQTRPAPVWLETGDAVGNMYSDLREEARDYARLRNVYFEQARQAYLVGNKALAKELSVKGQLHNMQMKAAHGKAQEAIYRQRNPVCQGNSRGNERMIDLHGLHVSEALQVLKHELSVLRSTARATLERLHVYICVGTGHHTRGSRTPARLPVAVQRYLLEEEGLDYSEPQAGLLRVIIY